MFRRFSRSKTSRVLVIGLDCASPQLVFDQFRGQLPHLEQLMNGGTWGTLNSCTPCITVPAWACMTTGRDPGELGVYGFRNRVDHSYDRMRVADGSSIAPKRLWDMLGDAGKTSVIASVPQTYPPRPLNGHLVSGFPAPGIDSAFTYPAILKTEVLRTAPDFAFDIADFRTEDKSALLQRILDFTEVQYRLARHLMQTKSWDFFMHVNMGVDRIHHAFWRYHDPNHRMYEADNPYENAIRDYYQLVDTKIGELLSNIDDTTAVLVVSDHGVKRMDGGICINEWLWRNDWLHFKTAPPDGVITAFDEQNVDWSRTRAWGSGGYYGRISLNVAGREPEGIVPLDNYEHVRNELAAALCAIPAPDGTSLKTQAFKPQEIYREVNGVAPDLIMYFGDLHWRSVGSLGHGKHYTLENDTGPDDANHAVEGLYILHDPANKGRGQVDGRSLFDVLPTVQHLLKVPLNEPSIGTSIT
jgi:predicted AlkP superfamily phosphohydrolase/phosphomutase